MQTQISQLPLLCDQSRFPSVVNFTVAAMKQAMQTYESPTFLTLMLRAVIALSISLGAATFLFASSAGLLHAAEVKSLPSKFATVAEKKRAFFAYMKPYVVAENQRIMQQRQRLLRLSTAGKVGKKDRVWLQRMADTYKVKLADNPDAGFWTAMRKRIDIVPVEMALVQAANESAWGQSRFAREGNNYFGQWCYSKGCGIVPSQRSKGSTHEVRTFDSPAESVHVYMRNINRSRAYREFRRLRAEQRAKSVPLDAEYLALGLKSYSERGMKYVKVIQSMIRSNRKLIANS